MIQEVVQAVEDTVRKVLGGVHTSMPAKIVAVYPESGMIDALPVGSYYCSGIEMEYPVVPGIPLVVTANSDGVGMCFPVKEGDTCLLIFAEQSISAFLTETSEAQSDERFELFNAIAIPGLCRVSNPAQQVANEEDCAVMAAGEVMIKVKEDGVTIVCEETRIEGDLRVTGTINADKVYASNLVYN